MGTIAPWLSGNSSFILSLPSLGIPDHRVSSSARLPVQYACIGGAGKTRRHFGDETSKERLARSRRRRSYQCLCTD